MASPLPLIIQSSVPEKVLSLVLMFAAYPIQKKQEQVLNLLGVGLGLIFS